MKLDYSHHIWLLLNGMERTTRAVIFGLILAHLGSQIYAGGSVKSAIDPKCLEWFIKAKLDPKLPCEWTRAAAPVSMSTFHCGRFCPQLCQLHQENQRIKDPSAYYPLLNPEELKLVAKNPSEGWTVYQQKELAERATMNNIKRNIEDDESDAFRHFVWAALLDKELGPENAKKFLDAHETNEPKTSPGRAMDLANNRAGLLVAETLKKKGQLSLPNIEKAAREALAEGSLVILRPRGLDLDMGGSQ